MRIFKSKLTGLVVIGGLALSGQSLADEISVREHLANAEATAYLQKGDVRIERIEAGNRTPDGAVAFQKYIGDLALHGARVIVIEEADGTVSRVLDDSTKDLVLRPAKIAVQKDAAIATAEAASPEAVSSEAELVWFRIGNQAFEAWEVTTALVDMGRPVSPTHMETVVDATTGVVLSQRQIDTKEYTPENANGVFPRIVINNTIGPAGSRAYAAPFDAVVELSVGCSGVLIAPNVVLCARHCGVGAGNTVIFGDNGAGLSVSVQSSFLPDGGGSLLDGGDVSILTLNSNVPANVAEPMRLIDETDELEGKVCATLGYGYNGVGSSGHGFSADGFRWGGENIIDAYGSPSGSSGSNIISTDFDNGTGGANTISGSSPTPLQFEATTAPGDSGGPVLVQFAGEWLVAGVLSGGTTSTSVYGDISWWTGTAIYRSDIESSGGEFVTGFEISLPNGTPDIISPAGGDLLDIATAPSPEDPAVPGSGTFHVDTGSGFQVSALAPNGLNAFTATFPSSDCLTDVEYYISFELQSGAMITLPDGAPGQTFSVTSADETAEVFVVDESFEAGLPGGWATSGLWNVTTGCAPSGSCDGVSWAYYGTASCDFDTGESAGTLSTNVKLPASGVITLTYCSALETEDLEPYDDAVFSAGSGAVVDTPNETLSWEERTVDLTSLAGQTIDLTWSFDTVDDINNDFRGWHVDSVRITATSAVCSETCAADITGKGGVVDTFDLLLLLEQWGTAGPDADIAGDGSNAPDGVVDTFDLLALLAAWGPCE